ncbi:MAG: hypothetical protein JXX14_23330 [Deltaproteobacteria bacterium]|nr:hypothetical protein [Deltaproteobacteria bacterium]
MDPEPLEESLTVTMFCGGAMEHLHEQGLKIPSPARVPFHLASSAGTQILMSSPESDVTPLCELRFPADVYIIIL